MSDGLAHLFGDYLAQSDWMATEKTSRSLPAAAHAFAYCFLPVTRSPRALAVIGGTHFVIDRWRLAKYVVFAKERLAPRSTWRDWDDTRARRAITTISPGVCRTMSSRARPRSRRG